MKGVVSAVAPQVQVLNAQNGKGCWVNWTRDCHWGYTCNRCSFPKSVGLNDTDVIVIDCRYSRPPSHISSRRSSSLLLFRCNLLKPRSPWKAPRSQCPGLHCSPDAKSKPLSVIDKLIGIETTQKVSRQQEVVDWETGGLYFWKADDPPIFTAHS